MTCSSSSAIHPCFDKEARHRYGRIHLPVAPHCNVQCRFCNRSFDCVNESRPGVTSQLLTPDQAIWYLDRAVERVPDLRVVGIAGPGDPFANPRQTMETLRLVRAGHPQMALCVSTNGLAVTEHIPALVDLGVRHLTITVNALSARVAAAIYRWVRDGSRIVHDDEAGACILEHQDAAIRAAHAAGMILKINHVCVPGVNDHESVAIAAHVAEMGADLFNLIPFLPAPGSHFFGRPAADPQAITALRTAAERHLPQMTHCARCRADAIGRIGAGCSSDAQDLLKEAATMSPAPTEDRPYVAVASMEGMLVNLHLGHCQRFLLYAADQDSFNLVAVREAPSPGEPDRWERLADVLHDCSAVVCTDAGGPPQQILRQFGITVHATEGMIDEALELVFSGQEDRLRTPLCSSGKSCGDCSGGGGLCG